MNDITYTTTEFQDLIEVDDVFDGIPPVNKRFLKAWEEVRSLGYFFIFRIFYAAFMIPVNWKITSKKWKNLNPF